MIRYSDGRNRISNAESLNWHLSTVVVWLARRLAVYD